VKRNHSRCRGHETVSPAHPQRSRLYSLPFPFFLIARILDLPCCLFAWNFCQGWLMFPGCFESDPSVLSSILPLLFPPFPLLGTSTARALFLKFPPTHTSSFPNSPQKGPLGDCFRLFPLPDQEFCFTRLFLWVCENVVRVALSPLFAPISFAVLLFCGLPNLLSFFPTTSFWKPKLRDELIRPDISFQLPPIAFSCVGARFSTCSSRCHHFLFL